MTQDASDQARKLIVGEYVEWIKRFDVSEYVKNRPMIEKLYEEKQLALATSLQLEVRAKESALRIHELELQNQRLEILIQETGRKSVMTFLLSLLATILVGVGVNIATSAPYAWTGWVMVVIACFLQGVAFFSMPKERTK